MAEKQQEPDFDCDGSRFCCSICLELLKEPVAIQCGHSFCRGCIQDCWDLEKKDEYSCPQCRETFRPRPMLRKNIILAEIMEKLKSTQQVSPSGLDCAGPTDVPCDFCCGTTRNKATTSCLTCLASYCPSHLTPHYSHSVYETHQLVSATVPLQEKLCKVHNKLMEIYCQRCRRCLCYLCTIDKHRNHSMVSAAAERAKEQDQLVLNRKTVQQRFKDREKELTEVIQVLKDFKTSSQDAEKSVSKMHDELISAISKKYILVKLQMKDREKTAVAEAEKLKLQLEEEIAKLKKRDIDLEQISHTKDHILFIQTFQSLSTSCESPDLPPDAVLRPRRSFETVTDCVAELGVNIEGLLQDAWPRISATVSSVDVLLPPLPNTREGFLRYCRRLTLDAKSLSSCSCLSLSQENRRVIRQYCQYYSCHTRQVLCCEGLSDRCYWEVGVSGRVFSVAVSYKDVSGTAASRQAFGNNDKSWSLVSSSEGYVFHHNRVSKVVSGPASSTIGVCLDYKAGILAFYGVSDTMTLLHKERTTFTQPLYAGLGLTGASSGSYAEVMKIW